MATAALDAITAHLDQILRTREIPDYGTALNGLQVQSSGTVHRVAAAVDLSKRVIEETIRAGADLLLVHHGAFWGGTQPISGPFYERLRLLLSNDIAVYSSHIPLDLHPDLGNNVLLAHALGLDPSGGFARYQTVSIGVRGEADIPTARLVERAEVFARQHGGTVRVSPQPAGDAHHTRRWAICTGAGASSDTIREAAAEGIDTLIVGEGPHHTAVEAPEAGLVIIYAGHYATETLGVRALAEHVASTFQVPWTFIEAPTGL